ncbi:MAG: phosphate acetyltransferase, partial [Kiritimatiellaeota bacterium]|nr:phosphate acetyltransferase [Kiritimatiellota bacterium]
MAVIDKLIAKAKEADGKIVLPEGHDPRVVAAANKIVSENIAEVVVLGTDDEIDVSCAAAGVEKRFFDVVNHLESALLEPYAEVFRELRKKKNMTLEKAFEYMKTRIFFGAMMVREGDADGMVAGSIAS